ncbi:3-deoxy-manno-octulosonate cytidylyltransferase [Legionella dresdenensis]|uniref:3-deoxy-manno-octulosonate cytidylyltransferase n=1 Tax=Legionella dresdenensis TaxID=450200 RepID=A0ABV8CGU0_9GAMM
MNSSGFHIIIPARYQSTRLPGKLLMDIAGQSVIERVYRQAVQAKPASITIAADNDKIADHVSNFGAEVIMTSVDHPTGTDRLAEVISRKGFGDDDIIVNVQGDEPFIAPALITQVANMIAGSDAPVATLCWPIEKFEQLHNPNVVKVVRDQFNQALYFSRSAIPAHRDEPDSIRNSFRHIGLYAYRAGFVKQFVNLPPCVIEHCEALEQLRVLWSGYKIRVDIACAPPQQDINTLEDLEHARFLHR